MIKKINFLSCLLAFMCVATAALADPSIQSMADPNADNAWIRPNLKVINNDASPMFMPSYTVEYYFYETNLNLSTLAASIWWYDLGEFSDVHVSFEPYEPPFDSEAKKANVVAVISFTQGWLAAGAEVVVSVGINAIGGGGAWHYFNPLDDWSYLPSTSHIENESIVLRDGNGEVVFGEEPGGGSTPRPNAAAVYWLGAHSTDEIDDITINEGDAYRNTDDGKAYVFFQDAWMLLDDNAFSGGEMMDSNSHINMNGSNLTNAGTVTCSSVSAAGNIRANSFTGDGSRLTNLQLGSGSVLFDHLNQSTLDALTAYIIDQLPTQNTIVSVVANPEESTFELRRSGDTQGELLVSYTLTRLSGDTATGTGVFGVGASMVLVDAYAGLHIAVNDNPLVYQRDPLHAEADLPQLSLKLQLLKVENNQVYLERELPFDEPLSIEYRITSPDGAVLETSNIWPAGIAQFVFGAYYGSLVELLPGIGYEIESNGDAVQLPVNEIFMEMNGTPANHEILLTRDYIASGSYEFELRITHNDHTQEMYLGVWPDNHSDTLVVAPPAIRDGDLVTLVPSVWYDIAPDGDEVVF